MAKKVKSFRLDTGLIAWVDGEAARRGLTQAAVVEEALESSREFGARLPVPPAPQVTVDAGRVEYARNIAVRQRKLNEAKERASR